MKIGVVGKPSSGKTTFFDAATMGNAQIASYPFTTIEPNLGTAFVRVPCPHKEIGKECNPKNSVCVNGTRFVPVQLLDVAGLVPGAHEGKGLGNQFLDNLMDADGLIHVVDMSGKTDAEGNPTTGHNPKEDISFLEAEIDYWILKILTKSWDSIQRRVKTGMKMDELIYQQVSGLNVNRDEIKEIVKELSISTDSSRDELLTLSSEIRKRNKPIIIAGNKIDLPEAKENYKILSKNVIPVSAESELALKRASEAGLIEYVPGGSGFKIISELNEKRKKALDYIRKNVLEPFGSTGVQKAIEEMVFGKLKMKVVFPVEDENHWTDKNGNVLPDAILLPKSATALDLAYKIHTDIGENFIGAIDARTKRKIGKDHVLKNGDIIRVIIKK